MTCPPFLIAIGLVVWGSSCTQHQADGFPYPASVVAAQEQRAYKNALWTVYTCYLDSSVFWQPPGDSAWRTLRGLVGLPQRLVSLDKGTGSIAFHFQVPQNAATQRLGNNSYRYGPPPFGYQLLVTVWVNRRDGLVDSVLSIHNVCSSLAPRPMQTASGRARGGQPSTRSSLFAADQPFKSAFLKANYYRLPKDLQLLCREKGITR